MTIELSVCSTTWWWLSLSWRSHTKHVDVRQRPSAGALELSSTAYPTQKSMSLWRHHGIGAPHDFTGAARDFVFYRGAQCGRPAEHRNPFAWIRPGAITVDSLVCGTALSAAVRACPRSVCTWQGSPLNCHAHREFARFGAENKSARYRLASPERPMLFLC